MYSILRSEIQPNECVSFHLRYLNQLPEDLDLIPGFEESKKTVYAFFSKLSKEKQDYRYAEGKWTIKEVLQHLIDTERIFMYRCFRLARKDATPLAGFEQNDYILPSRAADKDYADLLEEFLATKNFSLSLLNSFTKEDLTFIGTASNASISARAVAFLVLGHEIWHIDIINQRYL